MAQLKNLLCGLLVLSCFSMCSQPKVLEYRAIKDFAVTPAAGGKTTISMNLCLYNPNNYRMKLKKAGLNVLVNDNTLGSITVKNHIAIPRLDTFSLPVSLVVDPQNAFPGAIQMLFTGQLNVALKGSLKVGRSGLGLKIPVDYRSKEDLRSFFK